VLDSNLVRGSAAFSGGIFVLSVNRAWEVLDYFVKDANGKFFLGFDTDHIKLLYVKLFGGVAIFYVSSGAVAASLNGLPNYPASKILFRIVRCNIFLELLIVIDLVRSIR
jgi:hypothetical protein